MSEREKMFEPMTVTSIKIPSEHAKWLREHSVTYRHVIAAGIAALKHGDALAKAIEENDRMRIEMQSASRHKEMVWWIFRHHPNVYNDARIACNKDDKESV